MTGRLTAAAMAMVVAAAPAAAAPDAEALAAAYGARPAAWAMRLSPEGKQVLYFTAAGTAGRAVVVADVESGATRIVLSADQANVKPQSCSWKSEARIICQVYFIAVKGSEELTFNRSLSIAADGSSRVELGQRVTTNTVGIDQGGARVIDWLRDDPDHVLMQVNMVQTSNIGSNIADKGFGLSVQKVDVNTGRMVVVERPEPLAMAFDADDFGQVRYRMLGDRAGTGYLRDKADHYIRPKGSREWRQVHAETLSNQDSWTYLAFDDSGDGYYALRDKDGRQALFHEAGDGSGAGALVYAHPQVDVDGLLRIGKKPRTVAVSYTVDTTDYHWLDPVLGKRAAALSAALPGTPPVQILDESWDGKRNLVFAGGLSDPGHWYRYDTATRQLGALMPVYAGLADLPAAPQTSIRYKAADGTEVPAYLTLPPGPVVKGRPAIIMPHGGPASRDTLGFDWLPQYFAQLGYVVLQPNFRGSAGYGEAWYAQNGWKSWQTAIGDINAGARWLAVQGHADPARLAIVGWSYGGYAALQGAAVDPALYKAVVAVAPVTDLALWKQELRDYANYTVMQNFIGDGQHITEGSPAKQAARITAPVLIFHGTRDQNVDIEQGRAMDAALARAGKRHELIVYDGLDHQLDDSAARTDLLTRSAAFLAAAIGR